MSKSVKVVGKVEEVEAKEEEEAEKPKREEVIV